MDEKIFFKTLRGSLFPNLHQQNVNGIKALLESARRNDLPDPHHVAHVLAHVHRETGGYMMPIKETVYAWHKDKNPADATVINRLNNAWRKGRLKGVKRRYWLDGAFGRGQIQITHWDNYIKFGKRLGIDLRGKPYLALEPKISADIAVIGMKEGMFRKFGLSDYVFPRDLDNEPKYNPRRIVNGVDGSDDEVQDYHRDYYQALMAAGWESWAPALDHVAKPRKAPAEPGWFGKLIDFILNLFRS